MDLWNIGDRGVCAALMVLAAVLLAVRLPRRVARAAWLVLLAAGVTNALYLNLLPHNLINGNLVHYYLGAKYPIPYQSFYRSIHAALEEPQVDMRDLGQPDRFVRAKTNEQRAYYIDLLRDEGVEFDPLASLPQLHIQVAKAGVLRRISEQILNDAVPASQVEDFRRDLRLATPRVDGRPVTHDFGFNGSPFYAWVRHLDPTLHRPIGSMTAWLNIAWQALSVLVLAWLAGVALGVDINTRLAMAALVFASWDVIGYALLGLIFAGLWLPVAVTLYAMHRGNAAPAGIAIAWAGLIKLFPFVLLLPAGARLVRVGWRRVRYGKTNESPRRWLLIIAWCGAAVGVLAPAARFSGRSWLDFFDKIMIQFATEGTTANNVSLGKTLSTLGIEGTVLSAVLSVVSLAALTALFLRGSDEAVVAVLPRRALVLLAATGWVVPHWLNYYSVAALLLLPLIAKHHRVGAPAAAVAMAVAFLLPEFGDPVLEEYPALWTLKLMPYILVPAWLVYLEFRPMGLTKGMRRMAAAACAICLALAAAGAWRIHTIKKLSFTASELVNRGEGAAALERYQQLSRLSPRSTVAYTGMAVAYVNLGDADKAQESFERAVRLGPDNARVRQNYGRFLMNRGSTDAAAQEFEIARGLLPFDEYILFDLARARARQRLTAEAESLLTRARELKPTDKGIHALLKEIQDDSP